MDIDPQGVVTKYRYDIKNSEFYFLNNFTPLNWFTTLQNWYFATELKYFI